MRAESEQCPPANDPASESRASRRRFGWCVLAIVVLAAGLRLWSLDHGLPYSYYADESHFVKRSLAFGSGDLNPHWYHKPAFFMYALFFEYGVYFLFGKVVGWWSSPTAFAHHYFEDPGMFYALGRATASLAGVGVVLVTIFAARRLAGSARRAHRRAVSGHQLLPRGGRTVGQGGCSVHVVYRAGGLLVDPGS